MRKSLLDAQREKERRRERESDGVYVCTPLCVDYAALKGSLAALNNVSTEQSVGRVKKRIFDCHGKYDKSFWYLIAG